MCILITIYVCHEFFQLLKSVKSSQLFQVSTVYKITSRNNSCYVIESTSTMFDISFEDNVPYYIWIAMGM